MCGIFGVVCGQSVSLQALLDLLLGGLQSLEYRGYDSAGVATGDASGTLHIVKTVGRVGVLRDRVAADLQDGTGTLGIAHTRWATHGAPSERNAHPHRSAHFAVVHNGIITNHEDLRTLLHERHAVHFASETDTEVIVALCETMYVEGMYLDALVHAVCARLEGSYALLVVSSLHPGEMVATRRGSPLVIGLPPASSVTPSHVDWSGWPIDALQALSDETSPPLNNQDATHRYYFSSDAAVLAPHTNRIVYMHDGMIAHVRASGRLRIYWQHAAPEVSSLVTDGDDERSALNTIAMHGYDTHMLKEIYDQPAAIEQSLRGRLLDGTLTLNGLRDHWAAIGAARRFVFLACGTSYHAALVVRPAFERYAGVAAHVELASDFAQRAPPVYRDDVCVFVSQSGETADTLAALRYCRKRGTLCLGIVNVVGSAIARETDCGLYLNAGREVGVASTKAYTCSIVTMLLIALRLGLDRGSADAQALVGALPSLSSTVRECLDDARRRAVRAWAQRLHDTQCTRLILVGGGAADHATCLEGALKVTEIAYILSVGIDAAALKHGPLALVDAHLPMAVLATQGAGEALVRDKALPEICARNGYPMVLSHDETVVDGIWVPRTAHAALQPIANVIMFQLLAYELATLAGCNVDLPRNLAKSVTV